MIFLISVTQECDQETNQKYWLPAGASHDVKTIAGVDKFALTARYNKEDRGQSIQIYFHTIARQYYNYPSKLQ